MAGVVREDCRDKTDGCQCHYHEVNWRLSSESIFKVHLSTLQTGGSLAQLVATLVRSTK